MKKTLLAFALFLSIGEAAYSQECELPVKKGQKIKLSSISYSNVMGEDLAKWGKMKQDKKDALVIDHNAKVNEGKLKPKYVFDMTYEVTDITVGDDGIPFAKESTTIGGKTYESFVMCDKDNILLVRHLGLDEQTDHTGNFRVMLFMASKNYHEI